MSKFKFGDKVIHREYGAGVVVKEVALYSNVPVIFDGDLNTRWIASYDLNPIPNPDSSRLDWFEDHLKHGTWPIIAWDNESEMFAAILPNEAVKMFDNIRSVIDFSLEKKASEK